MLKQYDNLIYPRALWVCTEDDFPAVLSAFAPTEPATPWTEEAYEDSQYAAVSVYHKNTGNYGYLVLVKPDKHYPAWRHAAHEATHCAIMLCGDLGIGASTDNQEPMAYLVGYFTQCIMEVAEMLKDGKGRK